MALNKLLAELANSGYTLNKTEISDTEDFCNELFANKPSNISSDASAQLISDFFHLHVLAGLRSFFCDLEDNSSNHAGIVDAFNKISISAIKKVVMAILETPNAQRMLIESYIESYNDLNNSNNLLIFLEQALQFLYDADFSAESRDCFCLMLVSFPDLYNKLITEPLNREAKDGSSEYFAMPYGAYKHILSMCWSGHEVYYEGKVLLPLEIVLTRKVVGLVDVARSYLEVRHREGMSLDYWQRILSMMPLSPFWNQVPLGLYIMMQSQYLSNVSSANAISPLHISEGLLNTVVASGPWTGRSVALELATFPEVCQILAANEYRLAGMINETSLNTLTKIDGDIICISLAMVLASTVEGCKILAAKEYRLAGMINETSLNTLINKNDRTVMSVALLLSFSVEGRQILVANEYRLAGMINEVSLNTLTNLGNTSGFSLAFALASTVEGREILAADSYRLARLIDGTALNAVIEGGQNFGVTCRSVLLASAKGRRILGIIKSENSWACRISNSLLRLCG